MDGTIPTTAEWHPCHLAISPPAPRTTGRDLFDATPRLACMHAPLHLLNCTNKYLYARSMETAFFILRKEPLVTATVSPTMTSLLLQFPEFQMQHLAEKRSRLSCLSSRSASAVALRSPNDVGVIKRVGRWRRLITLAAAAAATFAFAPFFSDVHSHSNVGPPQITLNPL